MKKRGKSKMIMTCVLLMVAGIIIYLKVPYSQVKKEYWNTIDKLTQEYALPKNKITEEDLKVLPEVLQKYFIKNGYVGVENASTVVFDFKDVDFAMGVNKPNVKIDYIVHSFVKEPIRVALIDSKMYGIPFQGIDICKDGKGSMKGVVAKHITLFNTSFEIIDSAYLSECLMHPSLALQDNITYKQIDEYSVEATIRKNGVETTGIFYFNENYEMISFVDEKRLSAETNTHERWSAIPSEYKIFNGINRPTRFQAVWHYEDRDLIYFDGKDMNVSYQ